MKGLISIIVPVYRAEDYIVQAIEMVRAQSWQKWELLLIEDCSPDDSAKAIRSYLSDCVMRDIFAGQKGLRAVEEYTAPGGQKITLLCKAHNEGAARARNTGLSMAEGRYIAFMDADDVWYPDKLRKEMDLMNKKQAGFVFTAYEFGDEQARPTGRVVHVPPQLTYRQALSRTVIFTTTVLLDRTKIADELIRMPHVESEDTATWWQILREGHTAYGLDEVLAIYRRPARSLSSNKLVAVRRIWHLYRVREKLSAPASAWYFMMWAYRATRRRL